MAVRRPLYYNPLSSPTQLLRLLADPLMLLGGLLKKGILAFLVLSGCKQGKAAKHCAVFAAHNALREGEFSPSGALTGFLPSSLTGRPQEIDDTKRGATGMTFRIRQLTSGKKEQLIRRPWWKLEPFQGGKAEVAAIVFVVL